MIGRGRQLGFSRAPRPVTGVCNPGALPSSLARRPRGFTLIELLITISIIAIMASMMLMALYGAGEAAKTAKTRAMIAKIDAIIKARWETYQTRRVPVKTPPDEWNDVNGDGICTPGDFIDLNLNGVPNTGEPGFNDLNLDGMAQTGEYTDYNTNGTADPGEVLDSVNANGTPDVGEYIDYNGNGVPNVYPNRGYIRLYALRDTMRMELPDRWTDIIDDPQTWSGYPIARPAVSQGYLRKYNAIAGTVTGEYASAECLYLIVMASVPDDADSRDVFKGADVGDVDMDGAPELLDGWGQPIKFLRWAPGFQFSELQIAARGQASGGGPISITSPGLPAANGSFRGGTIVKLRAATAGSPSQPAMLDPTADARIIGYSFVNPTATITSPTTPPPPTINGDAILTNPDPFDPSLAHSPLDSPSFALYPLVYSAGPDKCYGILTDFAMTGGGEVRYASNTVRLNPMWSNTDPATSVVSFIGTARNDTTEKNYLENSWQDNIHSHMIGLR